MEYSGYAYFVERPRRLEDLTVPAEAEEVSAWSLEEVTKKQANLFNDLLHLADAVRFRGRADGVLVMPGEGPFVGWAAYCYK